jgi:hypothetical protein
LCGPQQDRGAICDNDSCHKDDASVGSETSEFQVIGLTHDKDNLVHTATARAEAAQVEERQSNEMILADASGHITMVRIMRRFAEDITLAAIQHFRGDMPHLQCDYTLVGEYGQNLSAPYFGGAQLVDTYYFSSINVCLFGLVDLSTSPNKMNCYTYSEDKDKKGENNVASLLMRDLKSRVWLCDNEPANYLTVIFDNCGGKNKNNVVLHLAPYLVEKVFSKEVAIAFYVLGHTKNACDRLLNQLKLRYHKQNVYTVHQVINVLNSQPNVTGIITLSTMKRCLISSITSLELGRETMCLLSIGMGIQLKWRRENIFMLIQLFRIC